MQPVRQGSTPTVLATSPAEEHSDSASSPQSQLTKTTSENDIAPLLKCGVLRSSSCSDVMLKDSTLDQVENNSAMDLRDNAVDSSEAHLVQDGRKAPAIQHNDSVPKTHSTVCDDSSTSHEASVDTVANPDAPVPPSDTHSDPAVVITSHDDSIASPGDPVTLSASHSDPVPSPVPPSTSHDDPSPTVPPPVPPSTSHDDPSPTAPPPVPPSTSHDDPSPIVSPPGDPGDPLPPSTSHDDRPSGSFDDTALPSAPNERGPTTSPDDELPVSPLPHSSPSTGSRGLAPTPPLTPTTATLAVDIQQLLDTLSTPLEPLTSAGVVKVPNLSLRSRYYRPSFKKVSLKQKRSIDRTEASDDGKREFLVCLNCICANLHHSFFFFRMAVVRYRQIRIADSGDSQNNSSCLGKMKQPCLKCQVFTCLLAILPWRKSWLAMKTFSTRCKQEWR